MKAWNTNPKGRYMVWYADVLQMKTKAKSAGHEQKEFDEPKHMISYISNPKGRSNKIWML